MTAEKTPRKPFHEEFAEKIISHLEAGTAPWQKPWTPGEQNSMPPHNPASGTVYKGMNRVNLAFSGYDDPRWMTYRQAQDVGMQVAAGSKATPVVYYQWTKEEIKKDENDKPVLGEDGNPEKETVRLDRPILRFAHVFNGSQIEGMPPLPPIEPGQRYEWEPIEKAEAILSASGAAIFHDQADRAYYAPMRDEIHLPPKEQFPTPGDYYGTALHELNHWTGHRSRLDRPGGPFGSEPYAREELRAEIASWMVSQDTGIPHNPEQHAAYVKSWIKSLKEDPYEIVRACRDAENIKEYVLGLELQKEKTVENEVQAARRIPEAEPIAAMGVPAAPAAEKTFLSVPYKEKEQAKKLGAKWDKEAKSWYAPEGADLNKLEKWLPDREKAAEVRLPSLSPQEEFAQTLEKAGLDLGGKLPEMDGQIHRVPLIDGKRGARDGAYCGYPDGVPAGWMENFSEGLRTKWVSTGHSLSKEQVEAMREEAEQRKIDRAAQLKIQHADAARDAHAEWIGHDWAKDDNPYLQAKGVQAFGLREELDGNLLVPVRNADGDLRGLQSISPEGVKRFQPGMEKNGNFHLIGAQDKDLSQTEIVLAEGYATGASLHMATGKPVAVAFDAGNLEPVARALREKFPQAQITICADNDHQHTRRTPEGPELWNKGVELAEKAAQAVGGKVVVPTFTKEEKERGLTDFNDLHQSRGLDEVRKQVGPERQQEKEREREKGKTRELSL